MAWMIKKVLELNQRRIAKKKRKRVLINIFAAVWCNITKINMRIVYFYLQFLKGSTNIIERVLYGFFCRYLYIYTYLNDKRLKSKYFVKDEKQGNANIYF